MTAVFTERPVPDLLALRQPVLIEYMVQHGADRAYATSAISALRDRVSARIARRHHRSITWAEAVFDKGIRFIADGGGAPDADTDIGWEALAVYTREYAALCTVLAGGYVHHQPNDVPGFRISGTDCTRPCTSDGDFLPTAGSPAVLG